MLKKEYIYGLNSLIAYFLPWFQIYFIGLGYKILKKLKLRSNISLTAAF